LAPAADEILAIPVERGWLSGQLMSQARSAAIAADGTFSLSLPKSSDWVVLLVDTTKADESRFIGSVTLRAGSGWNLVSLPLTGATIDAIALGTVDSSGENFDVVSSTSVDAAAFSMTAAELESFARTDDLFRNALNLVNNCGAFGNAANVWYQLRPDFSWEGSAGIDMGFSVPSELTYQGMQFQLDTSSTSVSIDALCDHSAVVSLAPPGPVLVGNMTSYDPSNVISSASVACTDIIRNGVAVSKEGWSGPPGVFYMSGGYGPSPTYSVGMTTPNPPGYWTWSERGSVKAKFDVSSVNPPLWADGANRPRGFVPSFKVNTGPSGLVTSVDVQWFFFDPTAAAGTGGYVPLDPSRLGVLRHFVERLEVKFDRTWNGTRRTEERYFDPATTTRIVPNQTWYYGQNPAHPDQETGLMGYYSVGGFGYFFHFRPALTGGP
jgi:hypothetical protein